MSRVRINNGFSIIELIAVIAIAVVLGGILLGIGSQIRSQANVRLAGSTIDVVVCALEQYYAVCDEFPFIADEAYVKADFEATLDEFLEVSAGTTGVDAITGSLADVDWSSGALYYFLQKIPNSKNIISALNESARTTKDATGTVVELDLDSDGAGDIYFMRFIDPWGKSLIYTYLADQSFPKVVSAGSDGVFGTGDDICSKR